jgi:hypothetical protein
MKPVTVSTVLHAGILPFIPDFVASLNEQTFRDFSAVFLVDGIADTRPLLQHARFNYEVINASGTPAENRLACIRMLATDPPPCVLFCDGDDVQQPDHIRESVDALETASVVCNDIDLVDQALRPSAIGIWRDRLANNFVFDAEFIADKNIVGLGNSAVRGELLTKDVVMPAATPAPDWLLFAQWLKGNQAVFLHTGKTLYRQHEGNLIGIRKPDLARLDKVIYAKTFHYQVLQALDPADKELARYLTELRTMAEASVHDKEDYLKLLHRQPVNYFWWEETNFWK